MELLKQAVKRRGLNIEVQLCDNPSPSHKIIFYYIDNPSPSHLHTILNPQASTPPIMLWKKKRIAGGGDLERHNRLPDVDRLARAQVHDWIQPLLIFKFKIFFQVHDWFQPWHIFKFKRYFQVQDWADTWDRH